MAALTSRVVWLAPALLVCTPVSAEGLDTSLRLNPDLFSVQVEEDDREELSKARFASGLGLELRNSLLELAVDYRVQSELRDEADRALVSQRLGASLHSSALNDVLGLNADLRAGSTIKQGGDAYEYSITPGVSKSLAELGNFSLQYEYLLGKADAEAAEREKTGYRMGLDGSAGDGRLTWKGNYRSTDVFGGVEQLQSIELLEFESSIQLVPELQLQLSGRSLDETLFEGGLENDFRTETRYGAGLAWSPSQHYSVAFKLNRLDESRQQQEEVFGSGTVSWYPQRNMEFTLSYGDHLVEGARGVMFSTKIDLNDY